MVLQRVKTREPLLKEYIRMNVYVNLLTVQSQHSAQMLEQSSGCSWLRQLLRVGPTSPTTSPQSNTSLLYVSDVCVGLVKQHLPTDPKGNTAALVSPHMKPDQGKLTGRVF